MRRLEKNIIQDIEKSYSKGETFNSIKNRLKISKSTVSYYINRAGLSRYKTPIKITKELLNTMQKDYDFGMTLKEISKKYRISLNRLQEIKRRIPKIYSKYEILKSRRYRIKRELTNYKGGKCEICGYSKCLAALEFHHLNPNEKDFNISQTSSYKNIEMLKREIDKCILVCSNCHREIHANLVSQK